MGEINFNDISNVIKKIIKQIDIDYRDIFKESLGSTKSIFQTFYSAYYTKVEGVSCSVDKARHTAHLMVKAIEEGTNISLKETYLEHFGKLDAIPDGLKDSANEITYWSPRTILDTDIAIHIFYNYVNIIHPKEESNEEKEN